MLSHAVIQGNRVQRRFPVGTSPSKLRVQCGRVDFVYEKGNHKRTGREGCGLPARRASDLMFDKVETGPAIPGIRHIAFHG